MQFTEISFCLILEPPDFHWLRFECAGHENINSNTCDCSGINSFKFHGPPICHALMQHHNIINGSPDA